MTPVLQAARLEARQLTEKLHANPDYKRLQILNQFIQAYGAAESPENSLENSLEAVSEGDLAPTLAETPSIAVQGLPNEGKPNLTPSPVAPSQTAPTETVAQPKEPAATNAAPRLSLTPKLSIAETIADHIYSQGQATTEEIIAMLREQDMLPRTKNIRANISARLSGDDRFTSVDQVWYPVERVRVNAQRLSTAA